MTISNQQRSASTNCGTAWPCYQHCS